MARLSPSSGRKRKWRCGLRRGSDCLLGGIQV
jgi:hypothetical protein